MNAVIQGLNADIGLIGFFMSLGIAYVVSRSLAKSKVEDATNQSQNNAIEAMDREIQSIRRKMDDLTKDNTKLKRTIETIQFALARRGLVITISDDIIDIIDNGKSTTVHIKENEE